MQKLTSTRSGSIVLGVFVALVAAAIVLFYLVQYRNDLNQSNQRVPVLVATSLIPKGTPGTLIASQQMYQTSEVPRKDVNDGAVTDPAFLHGKQAVADVNPGQQLTESDFKSVPAGQLNAQITGTMRAVAVPLDSAHGLIGNVQAGDHVDVIAGFNVEPINRKGQPVQGGVARPVTKTIIQDALVLSVPTQTSSGLSGSASTTTSNVVLELNQDQAAEVTFSVDNGKVWLSLVPQSGAKEGPPPFVTLETLLFGLKPIAAQNSFRG
jgi:Flp pilus assembly protein CpaB